MMRVVQNTILAITSILLSYLAIETAWRLYYFHTLKLDVIAKLSAKSHSIYHPEMGYTYIPNQTVALAHWPHFHVNKWGIIDDDDYPVEKPADEYRIVIIGDSFTAGVMNTVRWPALLQEKLNQSPIWRRIVNNKSTRVINFGRDGIGLVQFDKVLLLDGLKFTPDLILVNFIADDVMRKPYFRGTPLGEIWPQQRDQYVRSIADKIASRLPWFTIYPEVLAMITRERLIPTRISGAFFQVLVQVMVEDRNYSDKNQAVTVSVKALRNILAAHRNVRVMLHPQRGDFENNPLADVLANFERGLSDIHIEHMIGRFPPRPDAAEFDSWFIPNDNHPSDKGVRIYAQLVADYLLQGQHSTAGIR